MKVYEWWLSAHRPQWPPGVEAQAQAYDAFEAWREKRDPEGERNILDLIDEYAISANEQSALTKQEA
jgi:hypothetical protein